MSTVAPNSEPHQVASQHRCPYLGSADDPGTATLYPSPIGHCYRVAVHEAVDLDHQAQYCLSEAHQDCLVFRQTTAERLPKNLRRKGNYDYAIEPARSWGQRLSTWLLWGIVGCMIVLFVRTLVLDAGGEEPTAAANIPAFTATPTLTPSSTFTATPIPTPRPSQTAVTATLPVTFTPVSVASLTPSPTRTATATATPDESVITAISAAAGLNVYSGPHTSYPTVWQTEAVGQVLTIIGQSENGLWLQVCCAAGLGGWLTLESVTIEGDLAHVPVIPTAEPRAIIVPVRLNIRSGPGVIYPVLAIADQGAEYEIVASYQDGLWWQVCCVGNRRGWVIGESLIIYGDTGTVPEAVNIPPTPTFTPEPFLPPTPTVVGNEP